MKFKVKDIGIYANNYRTPKGNEYTFFKDKYLEIKDKDDIEYFKNDERFETETIIKEIKEKVIKKKEVKPKIKPKIKVKIRRRK